MRYMAHIRCAANGPGHMLCGNAEDGVCFVACPRADDR